MWSQHLQKQAQIISMMLLGGIAITIFALAIGVNASPIEAHEQVTTYNQALGAAITSLQELETPLATATATSPASATPSATATKAPSAGNICDGVTNAVDLAISQQASTTVLVSTKSVTYTIIIANCGSLELESVLLKHIAPPQLQGTKWTFEHVGVVQIKLNEEWAIPTLGSKEVTTATLTGQLVSVQSCPIKNKVEVTTLLFEPDKSNNTAETEVMVVGTAPCNQYTYLPSIFRQPTPTATNTPTETPIPPTATPTPTTSTDGTATAIARLTATAQASIRYKEDFNSTSNKKWYAGSAVPSENGFCNSVYRDSAYDVEADRGQTSSGKTTCWRWAPEAADNLKAVYGQFEVKAYHREGQSDSMFGIYMNGKGADELYLFRIWPNTASRTDSTKRCSDGGDWELIRVKGGVEKGLKNGRCHPAINEGAGADATNVLKTVHERSGKLSLYINGTLIDTYTDTSQLTAGYGTGIYVRSDGTKDIGIRFDDFTIYVEP